MLSSGFFRVLLCPILALNCHFSAVALAAGTEGAEREAPLQPVVRARSEDWTPLVVKGRDLKGPQDHAGVLEQGQPLSKELEEAVRNSQGTLVCYLWEFQSYYGPHENPWPSVEAALSETPEIDLDCVMSTIVSEMVMVTERIKQGAGQADPMASLISLANWVFSLAKKEERSQGVGAYCRALVADAGIDIVFWKAYINVAVRDIADGSVSKEVVMERLDAMLIETTTVGMAEAVEEIVQILLAGVEAINTAKYPGRIIGSATWYGHTDAANTPRPRKSCNLVTGDAALKGLGLEHERTDSHSRVGSSGCGNGAPNETLQPFMLMANGKIKNQGPIWLLEQARQESVDFSSLTRDLKLQNLEALEPDLEDNLVSRVGCMRVDDIDAERGVAEQRARRTALRNLRDGPVNGVHQVPCKEHNRRKEKSGFLIQGPECRFSIASMAAGPEVGGQQNLIHLLPTELKGRLLHYVGSKGRFQMLRAFEGAPKDFLQSLETELAVLKQHFNKDAATALIGVFVGGMVVGVDDESRKQGAELGMVVKSLKELVGGVFAVFSGIGDAMYLSTLCYAIVADQRLDDGMWRAYANVLMGDIVNGVSPEKVFTKLEAILVQAAKAGSMKVMGEIVSSAEQAGIRIDLAVCENSIIGAASKKGHVPMVEYLLTKKETRPDLYGGIDPAGGNNRAIREASRKGHVQLVAFLLKKKESDVDNKYGYREIDPTVNDNCAIQAASSGGHIDVVKLLLAKKEGEIGNKYGYQRIDPAGFGNWAIKWASANGRIEVVKFLLAKKESDVDNKYGYQMIDPAAGNNRAITWASANGHIVVVKLLLEKKEARPDLYGRIDPAADDNYAIRGASVNGYGEIVTLLLSKKEERPDLYGGIDPSACNDYATRWASNRNLLL